MTKKSPEKIDGRAENWEKGILGNDEAFAKLASEITSQSADDMLALQMISIRLQKSLISDLKFIAESNGINGYQPLIRRILERYVDSEMKLIARDAMSEKSIAHTEEAPVETKQQRRA